MARILVVENDRHWIDLYQSLLAGTAWKVDTVPSGKKALRRLEEQAYDLVISEMILPDMTGLDLLRKVKGQAGADVIIITGDSNVDAAVSALKNGARDYLIKPFVHDEFLHSVELTLEQRRVLDENQELKTLVNLFQTCQTLTNCLDLERLPAMVMDAFLREANFRRAIGLFADAEGRLDLHEVRGVAPEEGKILAEAVLQHLPSDASYLAVSLNDTGVADISRALILPVKPKGELHGIIALFDDPSREHPTFDRRLNFLLEQTAIAVDNASRFNSVRNLLNVDELTGLFNYRYLDVALEREIRRVERYGSSVSVLFLDLDYFKTVNDTHGHLVGSKVLQEMGALLKKSVRDVDIVIRYGGDEFTIILSELGTKGAANVAERIRASVENHHFLVSEGYDIRLTACLGYASFPDDCKTKIEMLDLADRAMYRGKTGGKNMTFHAAKLEPVRSTPQAP